MLLWVGGAAGKGRLAPESLPGLAIPSLSFQADAAKQTFWDTHCEPASISGRNSGIHLAYISKLAAPGTSWLVNDELSIADIAVWDMFDLLARIFPDTLAAAYPDLAAHQAKLAAVPGVKAYLECPLRLPKVNYNGLG
jgi:glutathione S-transferase